MDIDHDALPIHANATAPIRSRIFLEGNFYVDLTPGSPSAPDLKSGATLPAANTSGPVQLDRVLSALNSNARGNLQTLLRGLGAALNAEPTAAEDAGQDPSVKGLTGGQSLNKSLDYSVGAFRASSIVNEALLGTQPHDLENVVIGNSEVLQGLAGAGAQLAELRAYVQPDARRAGRAPAGAERRRSRCCRRCSRTRIRPTPRSTAPSAPTQQFAAAIVPGIKQLGPTISAALPWLSQATALSSQADLGGLLKDLAPAVDRHRAHDRRNEVAGQRV